MSNWKNSLRYKNIYVENIYAADMEYMQSSRAIQATFQKEYWASAYTIWRRGALFSTIYN